MRLTRFSRAAVAVFLATTAGAQTPSVAPTPPMGWNSWDAFGLTVTEPQFRANVKVLKDKLLPFGWQYAVIDEGWFFENPQVRGTPDKLHYAIDPNGRYVPVPARFPSSLMPASNGDMPAMPGKLPVTFENTSFIELGKWVHAQGLKFGIHIVRGIPRASVERNLPIANSAFKAQDAADTSDACPWDPTNWGVKDTPAGQAWYDSLLQQYAAWGVDLLKVDCISNHPYKLDEIEMIRRAIDKTGRPMVLSLSPGPTSLSHAAEVGKLATMWRISDDVWDVWDKLDPNFPTTVKGQFARFAAWERYAKPGNWPDGDMLPLGELRPSPGYEQARTTRLTPDEQRTQMTLWAIARSPLILGANLMLLNPSTLALFTNRDLLEVNQTSVDSAEVLHEDNLFAWRAKLPGAKFGLALFNTGDKPLTVDRKLSDFDPALHGEWNVHEAWSNKDMGKTRSVSLELPPHACVLLMLR